MRCEGERLRERLLLERSVLLVGFVDFVQVLMNL